MPGVVIHIDLGGNPIETELLDQLHHVIRILSLYNISVKVLGECTTAAAATSLKLSPFIANTQCLLIQPAQTYTSLRAVVDSFQLPLHQIIFISISPSTSLYKSAQNLGICALHSRPSDPSWTASILQWTAHANNSSSPRENLLRVGYIMRPSREQALHTSKLIHLEALESVCFLPLSPYLPLEAQPTVHVLLHKITDYAIASSTSTAQDKKKNNGTSRTLLEESKQNSSILEIDAAVLEFLKQAETKGIYILDSLDCVSSVMDRTLIAKAVESACKTVRKQAVPASCPAWAVVESFGPEVVKALRSAGVDIPCIVKPKVACGVADAHQMAFVLHMDAFEDLEVPLPAVVQSYSDHGGVVWKVYVIADKVYTHKKKSTPDLSPLSTLLATDPNCDIPTSLHFDSLHSLPVTLPKSLQPGGHAELQAESKAKAEALLRPQYLESIAHALREQLKLTLFGFDVVFDVTAGEARVVDLNYFPSFSSWEEAPEHFRAAIKRFAVGFGDIVNGGNSSIAS